MIKRDGYVIWPIYFDRQAKRSTRRRVPLSLAVKRPTAELIAKAALSLGWRAKVEPGSHPSAWWKKTGKVIVKPDKPMRKEEVIKILAHQMKKLER